MPAPRESVSASGTTSVSLTVTVGTVGAGVCCMEPDCDWRATPSDSDIRSGHITRTEPKNTMITALNVASIYVLDKEGGGLVFSSDDVRAMYDTLRERGVTDFTQEPPEHFYGTDMGVRDPFGNAIRILQQGKF